jgi:hypothetical protein
VLFDHCRRRVPRRPFAYHAACATTATRSPLPSTTSSTSIVRPPTAKTTRTPRPQPHHHLLREWRQLHCTLPRPQLSRRVCTPGVRPALRGVHHPTRPHPHLLLPVQCSYALPHPFATCRCGRHRTLLRGHQAQRPPICVALCSILGRQEFEDTTGGHYF